MERKEAKKKKEKKRKNRIKMKKEVKKGNDRLNLPMGQSPTIIKQIFLLEPNSLQRETVSVW